MQYLLHRINRHGLPVYDSLKPPRPEKSDEELEHERRLLETNKYWDAVMLKQMQPRNQQRRRLVPIPITAPSTINSNQTNGDK